MVQLQGCYGVSGGCAADCVVLDKMVLGVEGPVLVVKEAVLGLSMREAVVRANL